MAFQRISQSPEALLLAFQEAVRPLLYPSETDAPIEVQTIPAAEIGEACFFEDLGRLVYGPAEKPLPTGFQWAEFHRAESVGTQRFFRTTLDMITTYPSNEVYFHEPYHREQAPHWRRLRDLIFDNLIHCRWFRAELGEPDAARKDIFVVGRHVEIEVDADTNEMRTKPLDWILLSTYVIET